MRELYEEAGIQVAENDADPVAHLTFVFDAQPDWNLVVYVFLARQWSGTPTESREMKPQWFDVDEIPLDSMWESDRIWYKPFLEGKYFEGRAQFSMDKKMLSHELSTSEEHEGKFH